MPGELIIHGVVYAAITRARLVGHTTIPFKICVASKCRLWEEERKAGNVRERADSDPLLTLALQQVSSLNTLIEFHGLLPGTRRLSPSASFPGETFEMPDARGRAA